MTSQTVSLVLGSGGARGLAHVGVIHYLEATGHEIRSISGCSIGALIGGIYALGKLDEFAQWVCAITRLDMISLVDISLRGEGFVKGDKMIDRLRGFVGDSAIEDLPVKFTAVAADVGKGQEVWIDSGPVFDAIRASISLPLIFRPFTFHGKKLVDGGVLNPVPVAPTVRDTTDLTVAVNLGGLPQRAIPATEHPRRRADEGEAIHKRVAAFIADLRDGRPGSSRTDPGMYEIAQSAFDAMQSTIARHQLAAYRPDIEIVIARDTCKMLEFDRAAELVDIGYRAADAAMTPAPTS